MSIGQTKRIRRAICAVLQPLTGSRSTGALTVKAATGRTLVKVPRNTFWLPIPATAAGTLEIARHRPIITLAESEVTEAGTSVACSSLLGGLRQNLAADWGTGHTPILCRLSPAVDGLVQTAAVATAFTGGLDAVGEGAVREVLCYDAFATHQEAQDAFLARASDGPSVIVAWSSSARGRTPRRDGYLRPDAWEIYVVCPNRTTPEAREEEVTDILDGIEALLVSRGSVDGFTFSGPPTIITGRRLVKVTPTSAIYCVTCETELGVTRTETRSIALGDWAPMRKVKLDLQADNAPAVDLDVAADVEVDVAHDVAELYPHLIDSSGHGHTVEIVNMAVEDFERDVPGGGTGRSLAFAAANSEYGDGGDILDFDSADAFSLSCWVKTTAATAQYLMSRVSAATNGWGYGLLVSSSGGTLELSLRSYDGGSNHYCYVRTTSAAVNDGQWHHVAATYDGTARAAGIKLYIDGVEITAKTTVFDTLGTNHISHTAAFELSGFADGASYPLTGNLADPAVHNRVLTPTEVAAIYHAGAPTDLAGLASASHLEAYWRTSA